MPTMPPKPPAQPDEAHRHREIAESFGVDAERYDRTRPHYPNELIQRILEASPGPDLLDVGIGTGIEARQFQAAGCNVLGVEPDERMAEFARRSGIHVEVGTFESWDPHGRTFDAVIAGTAWHWVDAEAGAAKAADVLRLGGRLAVFWNVGQLPADLMQAIGELYLRVAPDSLQARGARMGMTSALAGYGQLFDKAIDGIRKCTAFGEPEQWRFDWQQIYSRDEWLDQVPTQGGHAQLSTEQLDAILEGIGELIDARGGSFAMEYTSVAITTAV
jgi:SAM-dependent methyltransferase